MTTKQRIEKKIQRRGERNGSPYSTRLDPGTAHHLRLTLEVEDAMRL
jgi:hypothetical protein